MPKVHLGLYLISNDQVFKYRKCNVRFDFWKIQCSILVFSIGIKAKLAPITHMTIKSVTLLGTDKI